MPLKPSNFVLPLLILIAAAVFLTGINWGLPSRTADPFLFGDRTPWNGKQIIDLAGGWEDHPDVGADVALNPLANRNRVIELNATDAQRAEIVRRYRFYSYQPDEMITLRALAAMKPGQLRLDPKLYQYGGLWIYPVGGLLKVASLFHLVTVRTDVAYYLDNPEQFGRFYIVARFYTVLWALAGVVAIYHIVRRIVGGWAYPSLAAACFIMMPVVMNMAHEAKPHLPGAVLMLFAVLAASKYVETGKTRWWATAGGLCGAAVAMVLSSVPAFGVLPLMVILRRMPMRQKLVVLVKSTSVGCVVYGVANPYVLINLLINRSVLQSNFGNSTAMYHAQFTLSGFANALKLIGVGTAPLLAMTGCAGAIALGIRTTQKRSIESTDARRRATGLLLALPALWVAAQCISVATGKPGEFGRFAILPDIFLMVEAVAAVATFVRRPALVGGMLSILLLTTAISGAIYLRGFLRDSGPGTGRLIEAERLRDLNGRDNSVLSLRAEPAPYCLPPVDLWSWRLQLLPREVAVDSPVMGKVVSLRTLDIPIHQGAWGWIVGTPISWADKPFDVREFYTTLR